MLSLIAFAAMMLLSAPLLLGFFGSWHPAFDAFAHFRVHLAVLMGVVALFLLPTTFWKEGAVAIAFALAALATVPNLLSIPGLGAVNAANQPKDATRAVYRLLQINLRFDNPFPEKVLSLIGSAKPDVITLDEVSTKWIPILDRISEAYPHRIVCKNPDAVGGVAILSRRPFEEGPAARCYDRGSLAIAPVNFGGQTVEVAAIHLDWPWPYSQARQIYHLSVPLAMLGKTAILAGDLNAAGWSAAAAKIGKAGGLTITGSTGPTWLHRDLPNGLRRWIGLPLDHVFAKGNVVVHSAVTQDYAGSDHLPVLVEFSLSSDAPAETATASASRQLPPNG